MQNEKLKMTIYKHYNKKEEYYIILDVCLLQDTFCEWKEAVLYKGLKFCRFESEFEDEFSAEIIKNR